MAKSDFCYPIFATFCMSGAPQKGHRGAYFAFILSSFYYHFSRCQ